MALAGEQTTLVISKIQIAKPIVTKTSAEKRCFLARTLFCVRLKAGSNAKATTRMVANRYRLASGNHKRVPASDTFSAI